MANALKSINARVKVLQKKHPKSKRTTLQKQAGREWKAGKLKNRKPAKRKSAPNKKAVRRKPAKRKSTPRKKSVVRTIKKYVRRAKKAVTKAPRKRRRAACKPAPRRRARVSGIGKSMGSLLPIAALAIGGVLLYKYMSTPTYPPFTNTANPYRAQSQDSLLQWAMAAGLGISAITQLINAINSKSDNEVQAAAQNPTAYIQSWGITAV